MEGQRLVFLLFGGKALDVRGDLASRRGSFFSSSRERV